MPTVAVHRLRSSALSAGLLLTLLSACTEPARPVGEAAKPPEDAVAVAGEVWVTVEELNHRLKLQQLEGAPPERIRQAAESLLEDKLLAREAERRGLPDETEVRLQLEEMRRRVLNEALLKREVPEPTAEELKHWYDTHPTAFQQPERARVARIVLPANRAPLAKRLLAEANRGTALSALAQKHATSALPLREEVLVVTERANAGMGEAPLKAKVGEAGLVETDQKLFVFKVLEKVPAERASFDESHVRSRIRVQMLAERRVQTRQALTKLARGANEPTIDEKQIERIAAPAQAEPSGDAAP